MTKKRQPNRSTAAATAAVLAAFALGADCRAGAAGPVGNDWTGSNWEIMMWTDPVTVAVDRASIAPQDGRLTAHVMWDYAEAHSAGELLAPYKSMIGIVVFDCATQRFGAAGSIAYSGDGGDGDAVAQYSIDPRQATLSATEPGTIGHDLVTYVCTHAPRGVQAG